MTRPVAEQHRGEVWGQELGLPHTREGIAGLAHLQEHVSHSAPDPGLEGVGRTHGGTRTRHGELGGARVRCQIRVHHFQVGVVLQLGVELGHGLIVLYHLIDET